MSYSFFNAGDGRMPSTLPRGTGEKPGTVYFAFKPEPDATDQAVFVGNRSRAKYGLVGEVSPTVLHMTVWPIGYRPGLPDEDIDVACRVGSRVAWKPFEIILDRIRTYPNGQEKLPFVAFAGNAVPKAALFRYALAGDLLRSGLIFHRKKLPDPHMTLFYDRRIVAEERIDPIRWTVREFVLIHSISGEGWHEVLGRWPLCG